MVLSPRRMLAVHIRLDLNRINWNLHILSFDLPVTRNMRLRPCPPHWQIIASIIFQLPELLMHPPRDFSFCINVMHPVGIGASAATRPYALVSSTPMSHKRSSRRSFYMFNHRNHVQSRIPYGDCSQAQSHHTPPSRRRRCRRLRICICVKPT